MHSSGNDAVDFVGRMSIWGNVIPQEWYQTVVKDNGKPYLLAIVILSEIVYWYRPEEVRDEVTGRTIGLRKKFKADMLQKSYPALAEKFGENRQSVERAVKFLCELGVIRKETRTVNTGEGKNLGNVLFIELIPEVLYELTYLSEPSDPYIKNDISPCIKNDISPCIKNDVSPYIKNDITYTKNTNTEITNTSSSSKPKSKKKKVIDEDDDLNKKINFAKIKQQYPEIAHMVIQIFSKLPEEKMAALSDKDFENICQNVVEYADQINVPERYIRTCIDNMLTGQKLAKKAREIRHPKPRSKPKSGNGMKSEYDFEKLEEVIFEN